MNELALFAGAGGGILGGKLLGWRTVCAVELDAYCRRVLLARQRDGFLPRFPIWDDVQTFDGRLWRGTVDVVSGGFPCTDISAAGKGAGIHGKQSGLWKQMARIVGEVRPRYVFVENSPLLVKRGLAVVLGDLAEMGYDARWGIVGAHHVGAPHKRDRIWVLAHAERFGPQGGREKREVEGSLGLCRRERRHEKEDLLWRIGGGREKSFVAVANIAGLEEREKPKELQRQRRTKADGTERPSLQQEWVNNCRAQWSTEPGVQRVVNGLAGRVDRLIAIGNGQVPAVAALAWRLLGGPDGDCGGAA